MKPLFRFLILFQVGLFFVGFMVPVNRAVSLWGKDRQERLRVVWPLGLLAEVIADQFPTNSVIFWTHPQSGAYQQLPYYFYPRRLSCTITNQFYSEKMFAAWDEKPDADWLAANGYTHVIDTSNGVLNAWGIVNAK